MRILHVADHTHLLNGMVHAMVDLACAQRSLGHDVAVSTSGGQLDALLQQNGVRLFPWRAAGLKSALTPFLDVGRAIRDFRPDVIHTHMVRSTVLAVPHAKLRGVPLVSCVQNSFSRFSPLMGLGDLVITGCQAVAEDMAGRGIPRRKLRPILNGTIGSLRHPAEWPEPEALQRPAVLTVCGLHPRKGVGDLIDALSRVRDDQPEVNLYIMGSGPYEQSYRDQVKPKDREHVHFISPRQDPRGYMSGADIFVLASLADPAPLVLSEAREAGLAVIATRVDGIPELLEMGRAGLLVPPSAPDLLAAEIARLTSNPDALAEWRRNSQFEIEKLSLSRVAAQTVAVYAELVNRRT